MWFNNDWHKLDLFFFSIYELQWGVEQELIHNCFNTTAVVVNWKELSCLL